MRACGIKLTHDSAVAVIDDGRLLFSVELEKLGNAPRHVKMGDLSVVGELLADHDIDPVTVDVWSIDGWGDDERPHRLTVGEGDRAISITVGGYIENAAGNALAMPVCGPLPAVVGPSGCGYVSFPHSVNHAMSAYVTSPSARRGEPALILVWDGGMRPTLYRLDPAGSRLARRSVLGPWYGNIYPDFISHLQPFRQRRARERAGDVPYQLSLPGTAMAYAALGSVPAEAAERMRHVLMTTDKLSKACGDEVAAAWRQVAPTGCRDVDVLATFQQVLGELLADELHRAVEADQASALCLAGGCALNIGWNTEVRRRLDVPVWVPPFPNDSGVALGAAAAALAAAGEGTAVEWDAYRGPALRAGPLPSGWSAAKCSPEELGAVLVEASRPIVFLQGRAELGPRALGNRSILAAPTLGMNDLLNEMKGRERYRPTAPVCLQERVAEVFDPGCPDPYMLFTQQVRAEWRMRVPAVTHVDGSARVQTVTAAANPVLARVLIGYEAASGLPVLCNTSANLPGRGFFPDAASAMNWGRSDLVWCEGTLFQRQG